MKDPGPFTDPTGWRGQEGVQNVLRYVREGNIVGLIGPPGEATSEVFAVIVPIEQYRRMTDATGD